MDVRPPIPSPAAGDCRNCGRPLPLGVMYCPHCGAATTTQANKGLSVWRVLGAICLGGIGLTAGAFGACLVIISGLDNNGSFDTSLIGWIALCLVIAAACVFGFVQLIRKR